MLRKVIALLLSISALLYGESAGNIDKIKGSALILRGGDTLLAKEGDAVESKDMVITQNRSKVWLKFADNTKITVGQNSVFEVQDYLFDKKESSKAKFKVRHGIFSAVTGKIGKIANKNFKLKLKTATIGVRGTAFEGEIGEGKEKVACTKGTITVEAKGKVIVVNEGESLEVKPQLFEEKKPVASIGKVSRVKGGVFLIRGKQTLFIDEGMELKSGDIPTSGNYGQIVIELISGEILTIDKLSSAQILLESLGSGFSAKIASLKGKIKVRAGGGRKFVRQGQIIETLNGKFNGPVRKYNSADGVGKNWVRR
jgi:hypothetical protein